MKSSRQKQRELSARRAERRAAEQSLATREQEQRMQREGVPVNEANLAPYNSVGPPDFVARGYYRDHSFTCTACTKREVWTAHQQKWWYEVAKGPVYSIAKLCRACRQQERRRREQDRAVHLEGLRQKRQTQSRHGP